MKWKTLTILAILLVITEIFTLINLESYAISQPNYLVHPDLNPGLLSIIGDELVVHDPVEGNIMFLDKRTGLAKTVDAPVDVVDMIAYNERIFMITSTGELTIYGLAEGLIGWIDLGGQPNDIEYSKDHILVTIPDNDLVILFDPLTLQEESRIEADVGYGIGKISVCNDILWIISSDGYTITRINLKSGDKESLKMDVKIQTLKCFSEGLIVASNEDKIYRISNGMGIEKIWNLERGSSIDVNLHILPDGRIIYVSRSRWTIGEIDGESINEVKVNGRIFGDSLDLDRIWFTEINTRKIGWLWLSRPPVVRSLIIEPKGDGLFEASAKITDPENEPLTAFLIVIVKSNIPYLSGDNRTYPMRYLADEDSFTSLFQLKSGEEAEAYVVAYDNVNNKAVSEKIPLKYIEEEEKTLTYTKTEIQPPQIESTDLYLLASSLLLLIPIIAAVIVFKGRKKTRRKPRR
ncbi:MAG: hypothetical protein ABDH32_07555 [Candidatus Caldarchaeales archaeon]